MKIKLTLLWVLLLTATIGIYPVMAQAPAGGVSAGTKSKANSTQRILIIPGAPNPAVNDMQQMNGDTQRIQQEQQIDKNRISNTQPSPEIKPVPSTGTDQKPIEEMNISQF